MPLAFAGLKVVEALWFLVDCEFIAGLVKDRSVRPVKPEAQVYDQAGGHEDQHRLGLSGIA